MKMSCENARTLVPSYLDGELSEEQAAPLRGHLFDCRACREEVKQGKVLRRWFSAARAALPPASVPPGFASRVARRAIALAEAELPSVEVRPGGSRGGAPATVPGARSGTLHLAGPGSGRPTATLLPFLLQLVAVAAALLFVFALALQKQALPDASSLEAQEDLPWEVETTEAPEATLGAAGAAAGSGVSASEAPGADRPAQDGRR